MSFIRHFGGNFMLVLITYGLPASSAPAVTGVAAEIRIVNDYMIVVPVTINGFGPYDFLLDTGSNNTILDQKLAEELALRRGDETTILGVTDSVTSSAIYANSFSIAGATVAGKNTLSFSCVLRSLAFPRPCVEYSARTFFRSSIF